MTGAGKAAIALMSLTAAIGVPFSGASLFAAQDSATAAQADGDEAAALNLNKEQYEQMYEVAAACSVSLTMLEENGATVESSPDDWINILFGLAERIDRDALIELRFRQTEVAAMLEVDPEETTQTLIRRADQCAALLPREETARDAAASPPAYLSRAAT